ncbi:hypothetical protein [Microbacterium dauci]|uniref:Uncharacterized protein n=1 Tax=Microbacterium dauci TaxID=3048008 RepID=A0ABT6ZFW6_9MICO|nr:hypothetical protein [Microbacterium sp. LX3-4]MDJ1114527.1 hypothetical protein [Microbacterium sp. LX3-4]
MTEREQTDADRTPGPPISAEPAASAHAASAEAPAGAPPVVPAASIEPPSEDVAATSAPPSLPGEHRGGFRREMTQPLPVAPPLLVHPDPVVDPQVHWIHPPPALPRSAGWALLFGVLALVLACFVGWGFPVGVLGLVLAVVALRRPWERREMAVWALGLSAASLVFSAGWLWWAHTQGALFA